MHLCRLHLARHHGLRHQVSALSVALLIAFTMQTAHAAALDAKRIGVAGGAAATTTPDGVVFRWRNCRREFGNCPATKTSLRIAAARSA